MFSVVVVIVVVVVVIIVVVVGAVVTVVVGVVTVVAAIAGVVGASVVLADELTCRTKVGHAASPAGLCSCPSPAVGSSGPFPYP